MRDHPLIHDFQMDQKRLLKKTGYGTLKISAISSITSDTEDSRPTHGLQIASIVATNKRTTNTVISPEVVPFRTALALQGLKYLDTAVFSQIAKGLESTPSFQGQQLQFLWKEKNKN